MKIIIIILINIFLYANANKTISKINHNKKRIFFMNQKLDSLASQIKKKQKELQNLNNQISNLNYQINKLQQTLKNSNYILKNLNDKKSQYIKEKEYIQKEIITFISENYINSITKTENLQELIKKEITKQILKNYSKKIAKLTNLDRKLSKKIYSINQEIKKVLNTKQKLNDKRKILSKLIKVQKQELISLRKKEKFYKEKLNTLIAQQKELQNKLKNLKIIKKRNNYHTKKSPSYYRRKTIPPIKGEITKKFGTYIDPIYHIKIDNPSITITPYRTNEVVRAIMNGKVVFIGTSHSKKVVIIKHKNNLFSIYANLDKISPLLHKGSRVRKGQIIARVIHSLEFEITYKDKPINPLKVINLQ